MDMPIPKPVKDGDGLDDGRPESLDPEPNYPTYTEHQIQKKKHCRKNEVPNLMSQFFRSFVPPHSGEWRHSPDWREHSVT